MKVTFDKMQELFHEAENVRNIVRNDDGRVIAFDFVRYYGNTRHNSKLIHVSLKSEKELKKLASVKLDEREFYTQLFDNVNDVENVKLSGEKIYKYELRGQKYKTDKLDKKTLFDFLPYKDFMRICRSRFWKKDTLLRNGYFGGLVGTNDSAIALWRLQQFGGLDDYDMYDVDFNSAYPACFKYALPTGFFYDAEQWAALEKKPNSFMRFYEICIKTLKNSFGVWIPPAPFVEYSDFDFLLTRESPRMVVSEYRLKLIDKVYGSDSYIVKREYFCATKIYLKMRRLTEQMYEAEREAKASGDAELVADYKIARNSLVGQFGRRDEKKSIKKLRVVKNGVTPDVVVPVWSVEHTEQRNFLPLAMTINDITACRLFKLLTADKRIRRVTFNTDGGVVLVPKGVNIKTSPKMGKLKVKKIEQPEFYATTLLYARPLIYDAANDECFNTHQIYKNDATGNFHFYQINNLNTRDGFIRYVADNVIAVEEYKGFNLRSSEVRARLSGTKKYRKLLAGGSFWAGEDKELQVEIQRLCNPYDAELNRIRSIHDAEPLALREVSDKEYLFLADIFFE